MTHKLTLAITGEWPLVHNSTMLGEAGYNFVGFDIASGAETLQHALTRHDQNRAEYKASTARLLKTVDPNNARVISSYEPAVGMMFE